VDWKDGNMKLIPLKRVLLPAATACAAAILIGACSSNGGKATATTGASATATGSTSTASPLGTRSVTPAASTSGTATAQQSAPAIPDAYDDSTDPMRMVTSYINAIDRKEYQRAYGYWHSPSQSLDDFKKGYATTANVTATIASASGIDAATSQRRTAIAVVLDATHTDGSAQRFSGCYISWKTVPGVSENPNDTLWHIEEATVAEASKSASLADLLAAACDSYKDRLSNFGQPYDNQTGSLNVVLSLYDAINRQDYKRAYGYWEQAPSSYDEFAKGYANTQSAVVTTGAPTDKGAAAGSVYERIPVIVTGTLKDGTVQRFSGCYTTRRSDIPKDGATDASSNPWMIYSAKLSQASKDSPASTLLADACNNAS
jgi:hypothetical protein